MQPQQYHTLSKREGAVESKKLFSVFFSWRISIHFSQSPINYLSAVHWQLYVSKPEAVVYLKHLDSTAVSPYQEALRSLRSFLTAIFQGLALLFSSCDTCICPEIPFWISTKIKSPPVWKFVLKLLYCYIIKTGFNYVRRLTQLLLLASMDFRMLEMLLSQIYFIFSCTFFLLKILSCSYKHKVQSAELAKFPHNSLPKCVHY